MKVAAPALAAPDESGLEQWILDTGADYDMCPTGTTGIRTKRNDLNTITIANGDAILDHTITVTSTHCKNELNASQSAACR